LCGSFLYISWFWRACLFASDSNLIVVNFIRRQTIES
jgi:hypothetical protein